MSSPTQSLKPLLQDDFKLKIIDDLGMLLPSANSKKKTRYAMFECPICASPFKATVNNAKRNTQKTCSSACGVPTGIGDTEISKKVLHEFMSYNTLTGIFTCKKKWSQRSVIGAKLGVTTSKGYLKIGFGNKEYLLHRLAFMYVTGKWPKDQVDHINHIKTDNRWTNLREVTAFTNQQNMSKSTRNSSGIVGVSYNTHRKKWQAQVRENGNTHSASFDTKFGAIRQRLKWNTQFNFHENHGKEYKPPHLHIEVPVYYTQTFKTKPSKTFLVGMNWYNTAHYYIRNEVKQEYSNLIIPLLQKEKFNITGTYEVAYIYHYKNTQSDLLNVGALMSKYFLDSAQKAGTVEEDNVMYCKKETFYVGKQEKENPRVDIFIRPYKVKEDNES